MSPGPGNASSAERRSSPGRLLLLLGAVLFGIAYLAALDNRFVSDDWFFLAEARSVLETGDFGRVFSFRSEWFYRPLQFLLTALLYQLTGLEPWSYRLVVILLHAANGLLLGRLTFRLLRRCAPVSALPARELAFLTAFFFLFSPRNHEAVFWYAAASEPLAMALRLIGLLLLLEALERSDRRGWLAALGVVAAFGAALATKEPSIAFGAEAGLLFLFVLATARERRREIFARGAAVGAGLIAVALSWLTGYLSASVSLQRSALVPLEATPVEWTLRLLQGFFRQLFFAPLIKQESTIWQLAALLLLCLAAAAAKRSWLVPFAFLWNLALLAPYAGTTAAIDQAQQVRILSRVAGFEDRYLYYPTAGLALFLIALADFLIFLLRSRPAAVAAARRALIFLVAAWTVAGTFLLFQRQGDWDRAGELARRQTAPLEPLAPKRGGVLCLSRLPAYFDNYRGHYVLRNALPNLLYARLGRRDFEVQLPPLTPQQEAGCAVVVDLNAAWAGRKEAVTFPQPDLVLERLATCFAEKKPATQTGAAQETLGRETLVYVHLFKRDSLRKVGEFLQSSAVFQQLEKPDEELLFFRLWVGGHRSAVLISELLLASFQENLQDPVFRARLLEMAGELGSRPEAEALLAAPLELPPSVRLYGHLRLFLPGPYAACDPARPAGADPL